MIKNSENLILIVCFIFSLFGLILIYIAATSIKPIELSISEINFQHIGKTVKTSGNISHKSHHPAGHLFLTISDNNEKIQVSLFSNLVSKFDDSEIKNFRKGRKIVVTGLVDEFRGRLQIIPRKTKDIEFYDN